MVERNKVSQILSEPVCGLKVGDFVTTNEHSIIYTIESTIPFKNRVRLKSFSRPNSYELPLDISELIKLEEVPSYPGHEIGERVIYGFGDLLGRVEKFLGSKSFVLV